MGSFLSSDLKLPEGFKVWHLLATIILIYIIPSVLRFPIWLWKTILNRRMAKHLRDTRDAKWVDFSKVAEKEGRLGDPAKRDALVKKLLSATVGELRQGLFNREFTSIDLVLCYGARCQKIGREKNYSTEELFLEAIEKARQCDAERERALQSNT